MKSVVQAAWLLNVAFGNIIVIIVAEAKAFDSQVPNCCPLKQNPKTYLFYQLGFVFSYFVKGRILKYL